MLPRSKISINYRFPPFSSLILSVYLHRVQKARLVAMCT